jgi:predicted permease
MRIPLLRGRALGEEDRADAPPVALVNASFARRVLGSADAIGQRVRVGSATDGPWRTIIGVVGDVRQVSLADAPPDAIYLPEAQWPYEDDAMSLVVRTHGEPAALAPRVRRAIRSVDADQPIVRVAAMPELLASSAAQRRFALQLFEAFAAIALLLAAAGIYGVLSGMVVERMRELGIRSALGATRRDILLLVLRRGLGVAAAGVVVGLAGALALSRVIEGLLFSISPVDPATYAMVALLLLVVALLACLFPALRAARVDPARTLRAE